LNTGITGRNNSHKIRPSRHVAEPASPPGERVCATYGQTCRTQNRWSTLDLRAEFIAIGSGKLRDPLSTAIITNDHTGQPSELAQVRRLTRTDSGHLATSQASIVDRRRAGEDFIHMAAERTPIVAEGRGGQVPPSP
jgi:hypothetical protein